MTSSIAIVADIGGTNTRVALADGKTVRADSIRRFSNAEYSGIAPILSQFLADAGLNAVNGACVAAAGPVRNGVAEMTNLDWTIDAACLIQSTGATQTAILNDLQAQGHALGHIAAENLRVIKAGPMTNGSAKLVVGVGTGMNAAPVHETPWGRIVAASECGHITMPVRSDIDLRLARFVETYGGQSHGFAGVEDVLAGRGLERIYAFVTAEAGAMVELKAAQIMAALEKGDAHARTTAAIYIRILGSALGDLALIHLPFGGLYIIGGVARAMTPYLHELGFGAAFTDKGRFAEFMQSFAVIVVEDDFAALTGCAVYLANGAKG